jgi:hypothetical protein
MNSICKTQSKSVNAEFPLRLLERCLGLRWSQDGRSGARFSIRELPAFLAFFPSSKMMWLAARTMLNFTGVTFPTSDTSPRHSSRCLCARNALCPDIWSDRVNDARSMGPRSQRSSRNSSSTCRYFSGSSYAGRCPLFSKNTTFAPGISWAIFHAFTGATFMSYRPVITSTGN